ncbi:MAG TPA: prolipoprotein diacylglyceryl transferase [Ruminococcaceae bacterium]|nr:prolipoprotein diacylglyceryl transferase [Oscillospiraceae bacterium]
METLSFPGLGLEFNLSRVAFSVGSFPIYWYGIIISLGFLAGLFYVFKRVKEFGLDSDRVTDVILGSVVAAVVGARAYFVIWKWEDYRDNLSEIFNIRAGGIAIYGAVIAAFLFALLMCRWRRVKTLPMFDLAVGGLIIGQAIGRWANFVNIEAFGSNTKMPWGMTSPAIVEYLQLHKAQLSAIGVKVDPSIPVHPTFLYESIWCVLGFLFILFYTKKRKFDGELLLFYVGWYGLGRMFIEGLRTDSLMIGSIRVSQLVALLTSIAAFVIWLIVRNKIKVQNDPEYLKLYVNTDEAKLVLSGEFYKKKENSAEQEETKPLQNDEELSQEDNQEQENDKSVISEHEISGDDDNNNSEVQ